MGCPHPRVSYTDADALDTSDEASGLGRDSAAVRRSCFDLCVPVSLAGARAVTTGNFLVAHFSLAVGFAGHAHVDCCIFGRNY